jgi:hypothetical protein
VNKIFHGFTVVALVFGGGAVAQQGQPGAHFIENWDLDQDGQITLSEARDKRGEVFTMFDQDENRELDSAEYSLFDETRQADMDVNAGGHMKGMMAKVNDGLMRGFNDLNADGRVSQDEFLSQTDPWFATLDQTGDGVITTEDFRPKQD